MTRPLRVAIAGGGVAALEALLALKALAEDRVEAELIAPDATFTERADSTRAVAGDTAPVAYALADVAAAAGARLTCDRVEAVAPYAHRIRLASCGHRGYDALVLALGARATAAIPGATTFRDGRDLPLVHGVVDDLVAGRAAGVTFAAPSGVSWTLPLYELALGTARRLSDAGVRARVTLATPERAPLEVFGPDAARAVGRLLARARVSLITGVHPAAVGRGELHLTGGWKVRTDRVVTVPRLRGRPITGLPADAHGFVPTDDAGRVRGVPDVFAAGDMTAFPVKQGGIAAQQADAVAQLLAVRAGAPIVGLDVTRVLTARLHGPRTPVVLSTVLDGDGRALDDGQAGHAATPWWPRSKVRSRHLAAHLAARGVGG